MAAHWVAKALTARSLPSNWVISPPAMLVSLLVSDVTSFPRLVVKFWFGVPKKKKNIQTLLDNQYEHAKAY